MRDMKKYWISTVASVPLALGMAGASVSLAVIATGATVAQAQNANPCNPCNPCAAKKKMMMENPCNPCAAKKKMMMENPCNPCAAKKKMMMENPCNPCAAKKSTNPCAPANPCAAKKKSKLNSSGGAVNPCAASRNPCNPCNPCAAGKTGRKVSDKKAGELFSALLPGLHALYAKGDHWAARKNWTEWENFVRTPYIAETHGERYAVNLANDVAARVYGQYHELKKMPAGGVIAKPSFMVNAAGKAVPGPLYIMEKMSKGWNPETADWRYAMIMPGGKTFGVTKGNNSAGMKFCHECHAGAKDNDYLFFSEEEYFLRK